MSLHRLANYGSLFSVRDVNLCCFYLGIAAQVSKVICGHLRSSFVFVTSSWEEKWHWWEMSCCLWTVSVLCLLWLYKGGSIVSTYFTFRPTFSQPEFLTMDLLLRIFVWILSDYLGFFTSALYWLLASCLALSFDAYLGSWLLNA